MAKKNPIESKQINCFSCIHFYITYEQDYPYGCWAMSFKSKEMPSVATYKNSGMECKSFNKKIKRNKRTLK